MNLSRASTTLGSMLSKSSAYPIHSLMMTSTFSGRSTSSIFPLMTSIRCSNPFSLTSRLACRVTLDASTAYTFFAPHLAANMDRMPVPHPTSRTTLPSICGLCASMASR